MIETSLKYQAGSRHSHSQNLYFFFGQRCESKENDPGSERVGPRLSGLTVRMRDFGYADMKKKIVICLPTKHLRVLKNSFKRVCAFHIKLEFEVLVI